MWMHLAHRKFIWLVVVSVTASIFVAKAASAGKLYYHQQRTCTKCVIPKQNYGHDTQHNGAVMLAVLDAAQGDGDSRRRTAHFRSTALTLDHLQFDQVGLAIYQTDGRIVASSRITHNGGSGLIGSNVTIRLRAFNANTSEPSRVPPDAVLVWESTRQIWVPQGRPQFVSLASSSELSSTSGLLRKNFDHITHLEVELSHKRDR